MKKIKQLLLLLSITSAIGISYTLYTLKNVPEIFDWEEEDSE